jgi:hypothetical protein
MKGIRRRSPGIVGIALIPIALLLGGCMDRGGPTETDPHPPPPPRAHDSRTFTIDESQPVFTALPGATAYHGIHEGLQGPAGYRIEVPDEWNGALVMYAHGYRGGIRELSVSNPALRAHLIANGYAWAASSYSANYYDVRAGIEDTNALALAFPELTGRPAPSRYYITGHSMGGHISAAAVERETRETTRNKVEYSGAVPMCGVLGDVELMDYFVAYNVALRQLAGIPVTSFPVTDHRRLLPDVRAALWIDYGTDPGALTPQGENARGILMNLSGGERPIFDEAFGTHQDRLQGYGDVDGTWGGILHDNAIATSGILYQFDADPALSDEEREFNQAIFRVSGNRAAANPPRPDGTRSMPLLQGQFSVPVVTLHSLGDLFVPFSMQQIYARRAAERQSDRWLVQRAIRGVGHCQFSTSEEAAAFDDMVLWDRQGVVPAGDDVLSPEVIGDPMYGCAFTRSTRSGLPACGAGGAALRDPRAADVLEPASAGAGEDP